MPTGSLRLVISELEYRNRGRLAWDGRVSLCVQTGDDLETHTSSFASIFFCFFDFRLSTFSHCASAGSPSGSTISESETCGDLLCFFEGADEDEEGRFMAVAFWEMEPLRPTRAPDSLSLSRWAVDTLIPTLTIQNTTSPLVQSGSNPSPATAQAILLVATFRMLTSHLSCSLIGWTMSNTFNSRDGAPQESLSQPFKKLSNKTINQPRRASPLGHLVSEPLSLSYCGSTVFSS